MSVFKRSMLTAAVSLPVLMLGAGLLAGQASAQAIIDNGTVALGVNAEGNLVTGGVGLTFLPSPLGAQDALTPGCACEGWGVADFTTAGSGAEFFGKAGESFGDANLSGATLTVSGTGTDPRSTGDSAVSRVDVSVAGSPLGLQVTHDYHPSVDARLYAVDVAIENTGTADIGDLRYRRAMDWDIPPTEFSEFVTIQGLPATDIVATSDNGFADGSPLVATGNITAPQDSNFVDDGPADHGATFDFSFGNLAVGDTKEFTIFYGAAANEAEALEALRAVGAEVFSLGQATGAGGNAADDQNTFIFAFAGVGGSALGGTQTDIYPLYVDMPLLVTNEHFRNIGLRMTGRIGGGETSTLSTVASMMDGAPYAMGAASGDTMASNMFGVSGLRAFLTGSVSSSKLSTSGGALGQDITGFAITAGIDYELVSGGDVVNNAIVGIGLGWSGYSSDAHDGGSNADGNGVTLLAYGGATLLDNLTVDATIGYSWLANESDRVAGANRFSADIDSSDFGALLRTGYRFDMPSDVEGATLAFVPYVELRYHASSVDGFSETGGVGARTVSGFSSDSLTTEVGLGAEMGVPSYILADTVLLRASAGWVHEYLDDALTVNQQVIATGTTLATRNANPDRNYARLGGGLSFPVTYDFAMGLDYEGIFGNEDYTNHLVTFRTRVAF
ncbi:autotransporter outer membrane beta-barrel domain-containing protein [Zavarzinia compransoris]|uniref:autotransporter family protein n=1 Tax=Zavarzinia marina TaxID=2911065 RepID=UPI001F3693D6|nr:autotransporter outer membrane beta-barrel domain-containing protein [Zavarzinia marina]MCF4165257.1 autotransporter outer membrane beta-barrel domain-containing protein [Zavarzinia marina]